MSFIKALAISLIAPAIAFAVSIWLFARPTDAAGGLAATSAWTSCSVGYVTSLSWTCSGPVEAAWLGLCAVATASATLVLLLFNRLIAGALGVHRAFLAIGFTPYALANLIAALVLGLGHLCLLGGAVWLLAADAHSDTPAIALGFLAAAALGLAWILLTQGLAFFRVPRSFVPARPVSLYEQPRLGLLIRDVAKRTGGRMPDNVVLGLEPTFFATSAPVQTPYLKAPLKGQTLHLSLPLMNLLSADELKAVIGHELGHFSGADTVYSMRFAPARVGISSAVEHIAAKRWSASGILSAPARLLLQDFVAVFDAVHGRISRERELRADKLGAKAATPDDVAFSLLKASIGGSVWQSVVGGMVERARKGRFSRNLVRNFADQLHFDIDRAKLPPIIKFALGDNQQHPTDSHPTTETRIRSLGLNVDAIVDDSRIIDKFFNTATSAATLDNLAPVEEDLTTLYYHMYAEDWRPDSPKEQDVNEIFLSLMRDFLARMVTVDGNVDDREIVAAERTAQKLFGDFDCDGFREACSRPEDLPDFDRMIELANNLLTASGAENLKSALRKVAEADDQILDAEKAMLDAIDERLVPAPSE